MSTEVAAAPTGTWPDRRAIAENVAVVSLCTSIGLGAANFGMYAVNAAKYGIFWVVVGPNWQTWLPLLAQVITFIAFGTQLRRITDAAAVTLAAAQLYVQLPYLTSPTIPVTSGLWLDLLWEVLPDLLTVAALFCLLCDSAYWQRHQGRPVTWARWALWIVLPVSGLQVGLSYLVVPLVSGPSTYPQLSLLPLAGWFIAALLYTRVVDCELPRFVLALGAGSMLLAQLPELTRECFQAAEQLRSYGGSYPTPSPLDATSYICGPFAVMAMCLIVSGLYSAREHATGEQPPPRAMQLATVASMPWPEQRQCPTEPALFPQYSSSASQ